MKLCELRQKKYSHDGETMQHDAASYLQFIEDEERLRKLRRRLGSILTIAVTGLCVSWLSFVGASPLIPSACFLAYLLGLSFVIRSQNRASWAREEAMFEQLDIDPELLGGNDVHQRLLLAAETGKFNEVQVKKMTGSIRGQDEKGFTGGTYDENPKAAHTRRDITESEGAYDGLEGDLRRSEHLVNEANERYSAVAERQWKEAESKDQDLIEAGVERLGDLVRTDWFEKNTKDGAVDELMGQGQKE